MLFASKVDQLIIRAEWWLQTKHIESQLYPRLDGNKGHVIGEDFDDTYLIDPYDRIQIKELNIQEDLEEPYIWLRLQAITCYQKALRIDPKHIFALTRLGLLYLSIADEINGEVKKQYLDKALTNVKRAHDLSPANPTINFVLGYIFGFYDIDQEKSRKHYHVCHEVSPCFFIPSWEDYSSVPSECLNHPISEQERIAVFLDSIQNTIQLEDFYRYAINTFPDPALMQIGLMEFIEMSRLIISLPEQYKETLEKRADFKGASLGCKLFQWRYTETLFMNHDSSAVEIYKEFFGEHEFKWLGDLQGYWRDTFENASIAAMADSLVEHGLPDEAKRLYTECCSYIPSNAYLWQQRVEMIRKIDGNVAAIKTCEAALQIHAKSAELYQDLIILLNDSNGIDVSRLRETLDAGKRNLESDFQFLSKYWEQRFYLKRDVRLALQSKRADLKVFLGEDWEKLTPEAKEKLVRAENAYSNFGGDPDTDIALPPESIEILYWTAWEIEVKYKITEKLINRLKQNTCITKSSRIRDIDFFVSEHPGPSAVATLIEKAFKASTEQPSKTWDVITEYFGGKDSALQFAEVAKGISNYRDPSAHTGSPTWQELHELRQKILGSKEQGEGAIVKIFRWTGYIK